MCSNPSCLYIDQFGSTALVSAAEKGHHECLSILLAHGAKVDKLKEVSEVSFNGDMKHYHIGFAGIGWFQGYRALTSAAGGGHRECLLILLAHGAEADKADVSACPY